jgi:lysozyme
MSEYNYRKALKLEDPAEVTSKFRSETGILSRPAQRGAETSESNLPGFFDMLKGFLGDDAKKVLSPKEDTLDLDAFYSQFDDITLQSAEEAALYRMEQGIKRSMPDPFGDTPEQKETYDVQTTDTDSSSAAGVQPLGGKVNTVDTTSTSDVSLDDFMQKQIAQHEGKRNYPYKDSEGKWTIGIGHLIGDGSDKALAKSGYSKYSKDNPMPDEKVSELFNKDLEKHRKIAESYPFYDKMNEEGKKAIIDLTFNMGDFYNKKKPDGTYMWENLREQLNNGEWDAAANNLASSKYARQVGNRAVTVTNQLRKAGE